MPDELRIGSWAAYVMTPAMLTGSLCRECGMAFPHRGTCPYSLALSNAAWVPPAQAGTYGLDPAQPPPDDVRLLIEQTVAEQAAWQVLVSHREAYSATPWWRLRERGRARRALDEAEELWSARALFQLADMRRV